MESHADLDGEIELIDHFQHVLVARNKLEYLITRQAHEQEKALETLHRALERDAANSGVPAVGIRAISLQQVPDAYRGFAGAIERLFGVEIQFVRAQGLDRQLQFNGVYLGGKTLFINVNSKSPYSTIIGHEFLHYLAKNNPALYQSFQKIAEPLMTERAEKYALARMAEYKAGGRSQMDAWARGQEEVYADMGPRRLGFPRRRNRPGAHRGTGRKGHCSCTAMIRWLPSANCCVVADAKGLCYVTSAHFRNADTNVGSASAVPTISTGGRGIPPPTGRNSQRQ